MARWKKHLWRAAVAVTATMTLFALLALALLRTGPGHGVIAWAAGAATGGEVRIAGLSGALPNHLRADRIELADGQGVWLRVDDLTLDWRALGALGNHAEVTRAVAAHIAVLRRPIREESSKGADWRIDVAHFAVARLDIAKPATGHAGAIAASGSLHYASLHALAADIDARRLDRDGSYKANIAIRDDRVRGTISVAESGDGLLGGVLGLPDLGAVALRAHVSGTNRFALTLRAGALSAQAQGAFDPAARTADAAFTASSAAMHPRGDLSWSAFSAKGRLSGALDKPRIDAVLSLADPKAGGVSASGVEIGLRGAGGAIDLDATVSGLAVPVPEPRLFAAAPVKLTAHLALDQPSRPVRFLLEHPLLRVQGSAHTQGPLEGDAAVATASLARFGSPFDGSADLRLHASGQSGAIAASLEGVVSTRGDAALARLLGARAGLDARATLRDGELVTAQASVQGAAAALRVTGTGGAVWNWRWQAALANVAMLAPTLRGRVNLGGTLAGTKDDLRLSGTGTALLGLRNSAPQSLSINLDANGLPDVARGRLAITGSFDNARLTVASRVSRDAKGVLAVALERATWKSVSAEGQGAIAARKPRGTLALKIGNLADLSGVLGTALSGAASLDAKLDGGIALGGNLRNAKLGGASVAALGLSAKIDDPFGKRKLHLGAKASTLKAAGFSGDAAVQADGTPDALAVDLSSIGTVAGMHVQAAGDVKLAPNAHRAVIGTLHGSLQDRNFALLAPATVDWSKGVSVDGLHARFATAELTVSGRVTPALALGVAAKNVTSAVTAPWLAQRWEGVLSGDAKLSGSLDKPVAQFTLRGDGLRPPGLPRSLPAAEVAASGRLHDDIVSLEATLLGGKAMRLSASGDVPLSPAHPIALKVEGEADLAMTAALIAASGQSLTGKISVHGRVGGTVAAPLAYGSAALAGGEFQDYARGIRLHAIAAQAEAQGALIRLTRFEAQAGHGSVSGSGTVDLAAAGTPLDLHFKAKGARPLVSDRLTATVDADLALAGPAKQARLAGKVQILEGSIVIPDRYPPNIAVLDVRRKGQAAPGRAPEAAVSIALDLTVESGGRLFVRGRGLDAELGGRFTLAGTADAPRVLGALEMRRGTLSVAGQTLTFRSGRVSFDGNGLRNRIDPTLDFTAVSESGGITATLNVGGYASAPQIKLSSAPSLPQDEVVARMLFQQSVKSLSPLQLAEIAQVLASLSGVGSGFDPVGSLRKSFGLDRLSVGGSSTGNSATIEAGKYVLKNVYVGARQDLSGGTRAVVEVDLARNLKAQATVSTGIAATTTPPGQAQTDTGDSVGLSYQFEY